MMDLKEYAHKGIYRQIVMSELSNKKKKRTGTIISCCECGATDKTLYKLNDEQMICIDCRKIAACCKCGRRDKTLYKLNDEQMMCIDCKKLF